MTKGTLVPPTSGRIGPSPGKKSKNLYPKGRSDLGGVGEGNKPARGSDKAGPQTSAEPRHPQSHAEFLKLGHSKGQKAK